VSLDDFQDFITALEDKPIDIKDRNFLGLSQLSEEFGFQALLGKLSAHRRSPALSDAQTAERRSRISALEERSRQHEDQFAALFPALGRFEGDLARLASEVEAFRESESFANSARRRCDCSANSVAVLSFTRRLPHGCRREM
jgi:hypothetical protein